METNDRPLYMIGVASQLCNVHPQTLRQYEKLGLVRPARVGSKNRLYSDADIRRVRQIQRLTQEMGVNLAGVELVLRLLEEMDAQRQEYERQVREYVWQVEQFVQSLQEGNPNTPVRSDEPVVPRPNIRSRPKIDL